jgi:superfamily II DNA/RNA helicase
MPQFNRSNRFSRNSFSRNSGSGGSSFSRNRQPFFQSRGRSQGKKMRGEHIDVSKFIKKSSDVVESKPVIIENVFADFGFCPQLQKNLQFRSYLTPTPIQDQSIKHIMQGGDLIGLANTGTGKTAAFLLPMIDKCFNDRTQKVLIVAPTRELAIQINEEFRKFAVGLNIYSAVVVGGAPSYRQISDLRRNPNFVIGTPGRLKDLKNKGHIRFTSFTNIVLDEIDRMLDMGFIDEIKQMLSEMPKEKQSLFFSATMPPRIRELAERFLINPITVKVSIGLTSENIDQDVVRVNKLTKFDKLKDLLITSELKKVLIFSETKRDVESLAESLMRDGFKADSIHGDKRQSQRQRALKNFKDSYIQILVATDVAARGLDIKNVTHVINYTVPQTFDDYIHRIGRTGRENKKGVALTFVESNQY